MFRNNSSSYASILSEGRGVVAILEPRLLMRKAKQILEVQCTLPSTAHEPCLSRPLPQPSDINLLRGPQQCTAVSASAPLSFGLPTMPFPLSLPNSSVALSDCNLAAPPLGCHSPWALLLPRTLSTQLCTSWFRVCFTHHQTVDCLWAESGSHSFMQREALVYIC